MAPINNDSVLIAKIHDSSPPSWYVKAVGVADPTFAKRFRQEARTIASLEHLAVVPVYDFGEHNGLPFLVMRLMTGGSLADQLANGPLSLPEAARILSALAPTLDEAHRQGIIHRDLKPPNILFEQHNMPALPILASPS